MVYVLMCYKYSFHVGCLHIHLIQAIFYFFAAYPGINEHMTFVCSNAYAIAAAATCNAA